MTPAPKNRIMIFGPKDDGTYVVEFRTAEGEALAISIPRSEAHVIRHFQERMPYGLFVPDVSQEVTGRRPQEDDAGRPAGFSFCSQTMLVAPKPNTSRNTIAAGLRRKARPRGRRINIAPAELTEQGRHL